MRTLMSWPSILVSLSQPVCGGSRSPRSPQLTWMHHWVSHACEEPDTPANNKCFPAITVAFLLYTASIFWPYAHRGSVSEIFCLTLLAKTLFFCLTLMHTHRVWKFSCGVAFQNRLWHKPFLNTGYISPIFNYIVGSGPRYRVEARHHVS